MAKIDFLPFFKLKKKKCFCTFELALFSILRALCTAREEDEEENEDYILPSTRWLGPKLEKISPLLFSCAGRTARLCTSVIWSALLSFKCRFTSWINIILKLAKTTSSILEFSLGNYTTVSMWLFAKELDLATFETKLESKMQEINSTS